MIVKPLEWYVDKLRNGEKFSLARWGDGELYCMWKQGSRNSNGCWYTDSLREALLKTMHIDSPSFIFGLQHVLPGDEKRIKKEYPHITWYDSEIFGEAVADGELFELIHQLRQMRVTLIGNGSLAPVADLLQAKFIEVPYTNAYDVRDTLIPQITGSDVYLFSTGMAANAFIGQLHGTVDAWLIDLGHIWDPFVGNMSRCDLINKTAEDINRNLYGS